MDGIYILGKGISTKYYAKSPMQKDFLSAGHFQLRDTSSFWCLWLYSTWVGPQGQHAVPGRAEESGGSAAIHFCIQAAGVEKFAAASWGICGVCSRVPL